MVNFYGWGSHPWCKWHSKCIFWTHWALSDFCPLHWIWWWATWNGTVKKFGQEFETIGQCPMRSNLNGGVISRLLPQDTLHNKSSGKSSSSWSRLYSRPVLMFTKVLPGRSPPWQKKGSAFTMAPRALCLRLQNVSQPAQRSQLILVRHTAAHLHCFSASAYRPRSH